MVPMGGRYVATIGLLALLAMVPPAWAHRPIDPSFAKKPQTGLACATVAPSQEQRYRLEGPVVSQCAAPPVSHDGFRPIDWTLDPGEPSPEASSRSIVIAVHEDGCTGGRNPIPHLQRPEVRYRDKTVVITLWIEALEGPQTCPGNPIGRLEVKLPGPLGARQIYDGSSDPPRKVELGEDPRRFPGR